MKIPFIHRYKAAHPRHPDNLPPGTGRGPTMRLGKSAIVLGPRPRLPDATPVQLGNPAPRTASIDELLDARKEARTAELKAFAYQATDELLGPNQRDRLSELKARNGELVELLRQYVASGNAEEALQLGGRLAQSWWMNGLQEQMRPLMADVMPLLHQGSDDARARAMAGMGSLEYALSDFDRARELYGDAVPLLEGDALLQAHVLDRAGMASRQQGAFDEAAGFHGRAADLLRQLPGTEAQLALCLNNLGVVELHRDGDFDAAHAHHSEALALRRTSATCAAPQVR